MEGIQERAGNTHNGGGHAPGAAPGAGRPAASPGSSAGRGRAATEAWDAEALVDELKHDVVEVVHTLEDIFCPPTRSRRVWHGAGLKARAERWFEGVAWAVVLLFAAGWAWSIAEARSAGADGRGRAATSAGATPRQKGNVTAATAAVTAAFTDPDRPTTAYLTDAAMNVLADLRGESGKLKVVLRAPGEPVAEGAAGGEVVAAPDSAAPGARAPQRVAVRVGTAVRPVGDLRVLTLTPLSARRNGRIGLYYIGAWPTEGGGRREARANYAPPRGLIEVTRETQSTPVSDHLRVADFLTHDQQDVWPKYVVIDPRNVDKLELVLADLEARGVPARGVHVMSGFRTPQYNRGGGDPTGRAGLSRHMYGDAADVFIDNDGDGRMDDLNRDRRRDVRDAMVVCEAVERVEREHPELVGGCGYYPANSAHGPFTHIDARGYRARWVGSGDGG